VALSPPSAQPRPDAGPTAAADGAEHPVIAAVGLTKAFSGHRAVDDLTLEVARGEVLALLGPNGAGKTTTVRLLNGVLAPDTGRATVLGFDPAVEGDAVRRRTGVLTESAGLDDRLTARENLVFTGRIRGMAVDEADRRATELLDRFGIGELADVRTHGFSTGQRKRVALARALLHDPDLLFLDEPTSGLDPAGTREVVDLIAHLATERGRTVVLCTHFLGEAGRLADRMAVLDHGRLAAFGRPEDLAAELWVGLDVDVDLGGPAEVALVGRVRPLDGVLDVRPSNDGLRIVVHDRGVLPHLTSALASLGVDLYGITPRPPTLEDVYFAIESGIEARS